MRKNKFIKAFLMLFLIVLSISNLSLAKKKYPPPRPRPDKHFCNHTGHWRRTSNPTCTSNGYEEWRCDKCGKRIEGHTIPALGHNYGGWHTSRYPSCTNSGKEYKRCSRCGRTITRYTDPYGHDWAPATCTEPQRCRRCGETSGGPLGHSPSGWKQTKTEHWKICNRCGVELQKGNHYDSDFNGRCDTCNFLMAIPAKASISSSQSVMEGEKASFSISLERGTPPIDYQWYYNTSNSTSNGVPISGATSTTYNISSTNKNMNGRYYYCGMTNKAGTHYSPTSLLTVYYPFTIGNHPQNVNLKKGETATFSVNIGVKGNPDNYTYQWYLSPNANSNGARIKGATTSTYSVTPRKNISQEYYYCVVSNGKYTRTSNRAKLVADITCPEINIGNYDRNMIINKGATIKIPFVVGDTGEGYTENGSNFTASDIILKVGGINNNATKTLKYIRAESGKYYYELELTNITGNGKLSIEVPANSFEDNFHNKNLFKKFDTGITIDNIAPVIAFESITSGINGVYANFEDTLMIKLSITESIGIDSSLFNENDVIVNIGGNIANNDLTKKVTFLEKAGDKYIYQLVLSNLKGDGNLTLRISYDSFRDLANNINVDTNLSITTGGNAIIIDNTKPNITGLITTLETYNSSRIYPQSIDSKHQNWAKESVYVQINAVDNREIDYYLKSVNGVNFVKNSSNQEILADSINANIIYKVVDKAGNISDPVNRIIKIDKITPDKPEISLTEQRENGAIYTYDGNMPTAKSIYVKPNISTIVDKGKVKSGIALPKTETCYTITRYKDKTKTKMIGAPMTYAYNEGVLLRNSGYFEITMFMTDIAGNRVNSNLYQVYILKNAENTIKIDNLNDIGSGISKVTIKIFKADEYGNETPQEAIEPIIIENPYKEIVKNVILGDGKFFVKVILEDKVGNKTLLESTIINKL